MAQQVSILAEYCTDWRVPLQSLVAGLHCATLANVPIPSRCCAFADQMYLCPERARGNQQAGQQP